MSQLRQCRKCKRIEMERVMQFVTQPGLSIPEQTEVVWLSPPDCFVPNLVVTLCLCPTCESEMKTVVE